MFQYYTLARLVNPNLLGTLQDDFFGSKEPYKVVIRQIGDVCMQVMFLDTCEVFSTQVNYHLFSYFDPKTTLYLFEPGTTVREPATVDCKTIATVSPNEKRFIFKICFLILLSLYIFFHLCVTVILTAFIFTFFLLLQYE